MIKLLSPLLLICLLVPRVQADTVLGITSAEITNWASRASSGPYKSAGDVSTNSPGDWDRIVTNRNAFASAPTSGRWSAVTTQGDGCVYSETATHAWPEPGTGETTYSMRIRDAAFHNMVTGVTTDHAALKTELLWITSQSFTNHATSTPWCFAKIFDFAPSFGISSIYLRLLFAYDYMGRAAFSSGELDQIDRWFFDAADFWRRDMDNGINGVFVDRWNDNYTRIEACDGDVVPYVGGAVIQSYGKFYNNRRGNILRFSSMVGLYLTAVGRNYTNGRYGTQADLVASGKRHVQEYIKFSVFPGGYVGDFERVFQGTEVGWRYGGAALGIINDMAIAYARMGDTSLITYSTALGTCNSTGTINDGGSRVGENKDLLFANQAYAKYPTDIYARYNGSNDSPTDANRIDGRVPKNGSSEHAVHENHLAVGNMYHRDTFVKQAYTRTHVNSHAYPSSPIDGPPPWMGTGAIYPGLLFMYGQMEDSSANPFLGGTPPPSGSGVLKLEVKRKLQ